MCSSIHIYLLHCFRLQLCPFCWPTLDDHIHSLLSESLYTVGFYFYFTTGFNVSSWVTGWQEITSEFFWKRLLNQMYVTFLLSGSGLCWKKTFSFSYYYCWGEGDIFRRSKFISLWSLWKRYVLNTMPGLKSNVLTPWLCFKSKAKYK